MAEPVVPTANGSGSADSTCFQSAARVLVGMVQAITGPWTGRNLLGWVLAIGAVFFIKGCVIDQYTIPSGSMEPTLRGDPRFFRGDRILVNKWLFGPRIPFTAHRLWKWGSPKRWDIVVFRSMDPNAEHPILVKRVVGLPGETVHIQGGYIWINGERKKPPEKWAETLRYTKRFELSETDKKRQLLRLARKNEALSVLNPQHDEVKGLYTEMARLHPSVANSDVDALSDTEVEVLCREVPAEAIHMVKKLYDFAQPPMLYGVKEEPQFSQIPEGHYFLLGDNSGASLDGRIFGWVPHNHLYGRAFAVWWPWSSRQDLSGFYRTWWGKGLLYGLPLALIVVEMLVLRRQKRRPS